MQFSEFAYPNRNAARAQSSKVAILGGEGQIAAIIAGQLTRTCSSGFGRWNDATFPGAFLMSPGARRINGHRMVVESSRSVCTAV